MKLHFQLIFASFVQRPRQRKIKRKGREDFAYFCVSGTDLASKEKKRKGDFCIFFAFFFVSGTDLASPSSDMTRSGDEARQE